MLQLEYNNTLEIANEFINHTNKSIFLTGKAGTGKTTFLNHLKEHTSKNFAIVAPTGIAAINANGVTINSFFNIPFGPFHPQRNQFSITIDSKKKKVIQELQLLVIDEVSMLRADTLDAIDYVLKNARKKTDLPFGGVQILYVGDLYQLPPVVAAEEWKQLKSFYAGINFLHSKQIKKQQPVLIELQQVYRQNDDLFIQLLNAVRTGVCNESDIALLNSRYQSTNISNQIFLTTHNDKANAINSTALNELNSDEFISLAEVTGDFDEASFPTESTLNLKIGARIILLRNDRNKSKKYYNGKTGLIEAIKHEKLSILFDDGELIDIEKEVWEKFAYHFNENLGLIEKIQTGSFKQFPVRLAWAITIHKSQGLTFEGAVIDLKDVFSPGQVYVALSRIKSLEGVMLSSKVSGELINKAVSVPKLPLLQLSERELQNLLVAEKLIFAEETLKALFDWSEIALMLSKNILLVKDYHAIDEMISHIEKCNKTSIIFQEEIITICHSDKSDKFKILRERVNNATTYYLNTLNDKVSGALKDENGKTKNSINLKFRFRFINELKLLIEKKRLDLQSAEKFVNSIE